MLSFLCKRLKTPNYSLNFKSQAYGWRYSSVVAHSSSMFKALGSIPSIITNKDKQTTNEPINLTGLHMCKRFK